MTMKTHEVTIHARVTKAGDTFTKTAGAAVKTGTGNGTISAITVDQTLGQIETITLTATSATEFSVVGSVSGTHDVATVGTEYAGIVGFTITAGGTAFTAGTTFVFSITNVEDYPFSSHTFVIDEFLIDGVEKATDALNSELRAALATAGKNAVGGILSR